jgi:ribonuclease P protein component
VVFSLPSRSSEPEVGFVAGRSVGNAPTRNRAKRRLREASRQAPLVGNRAYVMVATADVADVPFVDLVASVTEAATAIEEEAS